MGCLASHHKPHRALTSVAAKACLVAVWLSLAACDKGTPAYDVVINDGRVIDPESQLDAIRSLGIRSGKIVSISEDPLVAETAVDASGLVISPGFVLTCIRIVWRSPDTVSSCSMASRRFWSWKPEVFRSIVSGSSWERRPLLTLAPLLDTPGFECR